MTNDHVSDAGEANLLIAGFLKCGTTSLARYLADHPDVATPEVKELYRYVDPGTSLEEYGRKIRDTVPPPSRGQRRYLMDATPFYYGQSAALQHVRSNPSTKVIFMVRKPLARLKSSFRFFSEMYQEYPSSTFAEFIAALLDPPVGKSYKADMKSNFFRELFDLELQMGRYTDHIDKWIAALDQSQILVLSLEELEAEPGLLMSRVCAFLNIPDDVYRDYQFKAYMRSHGVRSRWLARTLRRVGGEDMMRYQSLTEYQNPLHFIGGGAAIRALSRVVGSLQMRRVEYDLPPHLSQQIEQFYGSSIHKLRESYQIGY